jgi:hypothetical protein
MIKSVTNINFAILDALHCCGNHTMVSYFIRSFRCEFPSLLSYKNCTFLFLKHFISKRVACKLCSHTNVKKMIACEYVSAFFPFFLM